MFQMLCAFSTSKRVRSLCLALLCLWLTLVSCFFSLWSLDALPSYITRFSNAGVCFCDSGKYFDGRKCLDLAGR
jgi:hypothetical protein